MMGEFKGSLKFTEHGEHQRPTISINPKSSSSSAGESLFLGMSGASPSPMTIVSNIFNEHYANNEFRSFSDLLTGDINSPAHPVGGLMTFLPENWGAGEALAKSDDKGGNDGACGFKQKRPGNLVLPVPVSQVFAVSPGFSPSSFLNSPTFFPLSPFGMSPQQTFAQVTAKAAISQAQLGIQAELFHPSSSSAQPSNAPSMNYQTSMFTVASRQPVSEPSNAPLPDRRPPNFPMNVDKPADDGYNWRKYGQKQVKGSEYPRSYYRCTSANCPVKKKVERSFDGHITEIIYKGQHNHEPPQPGRRGKDSCLQADHGSEGAAGQFRWSGGRGRDYDCAQATSMQLHGPSDSEESGENFHQVEDDDDDDDEPKAKKRNAGAGQSDIPFTHRTMTEPKIVVQTRSDVDLLDDGYRWRKYGQKVVKGNPNPRSYYKCTTVGCKVRKHVERASTDQRAVITTYEGKHNHDVPPARGSNMSAANMEAQQLKLHNSVGQVDFGNKNQRPIALRLKEEQIVV